MRRPLAASAFLDFEREDEEEEEDGTRTTDVLFLLPCTWRDPCAIAPHFLLVGCVSQYPVLHILGAMENLAWLDCRALSSNTRNGGGGYGMRPKIKGSSCRRGSSSQSLSELSVCANLSDKAM